MTFIFPIANILTSIPVFSIIIRYNLLQLQGLRVPVWVANLLAVVLPWIVVLPFFPGDSLDDVVNWSSALLFTLLNLIFPAAFFVASSWRTRAGLPPVVVHDAEDDVSARAHGDDEHDDLHYLLAASAGGDAEAPLVASLNQPAAHAGSAEVIDVLPTCGGASATREAELRYAYALLVISSVLAVACLGIQIYSVFDTSS